MFEDRPTIPLGTYDMIDPAVRDLWLAALESGDYAQTRGTLRDSQGYCCLGVLCDVALNAGISECKVPTGRALIHKGERITIEELRDSGSVAALTATVPHGFFGIAQAALSRLMALNDTQMLSLAEIAAAIRASKLPAPEDLTVGFFRDWVHHQTGTYDYCDNLNCAMGRFLQDYRIPFTVVVPHEVWRGDAPTLHIHPDVQYHLNRTGSDRPRTFLNLFFALQEVEPTDPLFTIRSAE